MNFTLGTSVTWTSGAGGGETVKTGEVVAIVPAGSRIKEFVYSYLSAGETNCSGLDMEGLPRNHESYLVLVPAAGKGRPKLYWPRVSKLALEGAERVAVGTLAFEEVGK